MAAIDYTSKTRFLDDHDALPEQQAKPRFRLFAALAAPFRDIDDRALNRHRPREVMRNNSKGNQFMSGTPASARIQVRRFQRSGD